MIFAVFTRINRAPELKFQNRILPSHTSNQQITGLTKKTMMRLIQIVLLTWALSLQEIRAAEDDSRQLLAVRAYGANPNFKLGRCEGAKTNRQIGIGPDIALTNLLYIFQAIVTRTTIGKSGLIDHGWMCIFLFLLLFASRLFYHVMCSHGFIRSFVHPDSLNGMVCFQRGSNKAVPGCTGGGSDGSRSDYWWVARNWISFATVGHGTHIILAQIL